MNKKKWRSNIRTFIYFNNGFLNANPQNSVRRQKIRTIFWQYSF